MHVTFLETNKSLHRRPLFGGEDIRFFINEQKYVHIRPGWLLYIADKVHWPSFCRDDKEHILCSIRDMNFIDWKQYAKIRDTRNK